MTDRFDEAKRALEGVPAHDVWAEAERRAADGAVVPLAPLPARPPRRTARWAAAAAAVVLLIAGTVAVLANDGDSPVDSGPAAPGSGDPSGEQVTVYQADGACKLGIMGEPLPEPLRVTRVELTEENHSTLVEGNFSPSQYFDVQVGGQVVTDLVGERVEDVQIQRGTANLWFQGAQVTMLDGRITQNPVQLRWFTGSPEPCESFTVTVDGGTEDENRHAAVDLGERVLMSSEVAELSVEHPTPGGNPLADTLWQLESSTIDGEPTEGPGLVFSFDEGFVAWTDGCNSMSAGYAYDDGMLDVGAPTTTLVGCPSNPTSSAIGAVMGGGPIAVTFEGDLLELRGGTTVLILRPADLDAGDPGGPEAGEDTPTGPSTTTSMVSSGVPSDLAGLWEISGLNDGTALPDGELLVEFSRAGVSWTDGCTGHSGNATFLADDAFSVSNVAEDGVACPENSGRDAINAVFAAPLVEVTVDGDVARLVAGAHLITLERQ